MQWDIDRCHNDDGIKREIHDSTALLSKELHVPKRGGCLTIDYHLGMHDTCALKVRLLDSSQSWEGMHYPRQKERIYYKKSKSNHGKIQRAFITIPPPRGGCPLRKVS